MRRFLFITTGAGLLLWSVLAQRAEVEAVEIGRHNLHLLPAGKEADGIPGDFILRNSKVHALISGAQPLRRANMSTEYGFVTQGALYDLDLRAAANDQITAFRPGNFGGEISYVRVAESGPRAAVEAVRTAAQSDGLYTRHEYSLEQDWQHILITSTYRNESRQPKTIPPQPAWKAFSTEWDVAGVQVGDAIDPFDKRAYAYTSLSGTIEKEATLQPSETRTYKVALAVADSPAAAYGVIAALLGPTGALTATVKDDSPEPPLHGALLLPVAGKNLPAYPNAAGAIALRLPPGAYSATFQDIGRDPTAQTITIAANQTATTTLALPRASLVRMDLRDERGARSPGRVQFLGVDGTETPDLGTDYRAHGGNHQYQTHDGQVRQQVPPGKYLLRITRGPEFDLEEKTVSVAKGQTVDVSVTLRRTVDTTGWVSTDYHAHSTPSGDNYCSTTDRLINFAAEHLEFVPTTEHNRIYDWAPLIAKLGLAPHMKTVTGIELTGSGQHFNAFPLQPDPLAQNGGAPVWNYDPRINAIALRHWGAPTSTGGSRIDTELNARIKGARTEDPGRWVQANHPIVGTVFFDRDGNGVQDGGFAGFEQMIDGAEVWSTEILNLHPTYSGKGVAGAGNAGLQNRTFGWLQMLNQGRRVWCVAVSDAHRVFGNGVGAWRTYVPSATDDPARIDPAEMIRNSKAGRMMLTNGPFLTVATADGLPIGSTVIAEGHLDLNISVKAANWVAVDRVQILVNGRQPAAYNFTKRQHPAMFPNGTLRFQQTVRVKLEQDAHLIVVATSESADLKNGWGRNPYGNMHPIAYTNPIFVDVDRNGWQPSGDTLGHPLITTPKPAAR